MKKGRKLFVAALITLSLAVGYSIGNIGQSKSADPIVKKDTTITTNIVKDPGGGSGT